MKIVATVDTNYLSIAENWVRSIKKLGIENYTIYCLEKEAKEYLEPKGINCTYDERFDISLFLEEEILNGKEFKKIARAKTFLFREFARLREPVIFSDLDAIWLKDPISIVESHFNKFDVVFSLVEKKKCYPPRVWEKLGYTMCTGFFGINPTEKSLRFFEELVPYSRHRGGDDQMWFNLYSILDREYDARDINDGSKDIFVKDLLDIKVLPSSVVIRGLPNENTYVAHPVSGKTEEQTSGKLKDQGLWINE